MTRLRKPLVGSSWTDQQIAAFKNWTDALPFPSRYDAIEAELAFLTWRVLTVMLSENEPGTFFEEDEVPERLAPEDVECMQQMKSVALDLVCRRLLDDRPITGPSTLTRRENAPPYPPPPDVVDLAGEVEQFLREHQHLVSEGDLPLIRQALDVALTDQASYNETKRARARAKKGK